MEREMGYGLQTRSSNSRFGVYISLVLNYQLIRAYICNRYKYCRKKNCVLEGLEGQMEAVLISFVFVGGSQKRSEGGEEAEIG